MLSRIAPVLALIGIPLSIWDMGMYGDLWALFYCWFCLTIIFWWYLANIVFTTSKKERRNAAFKRVMSKKKRPRTYDGTDSKVTQFKSNTRKEN